MEVFSKLLNKSNSDSSLGRGPLDSSKSICVPFTQACWALVLTVTVVVKLLASIAAAELKRGAWKQLKHHKNCCSCRDSIIFLKKLILSDFYKPFVLEKLILTVFVSVLTAFMEEWIFGGPYSTILEVELYIIFLLVQPINIIHRQVH